MVRPVAVIATAIAIVAPTMPRVERTRYAQVLRAEARDHAFDPLTGVAIIWHESGWNPHAVSRNGEDYGLAQIRARYMGACRTDDQPARAPSPGCRAVHASLLDGAYNIRLMAAQITRWRKLCRKTTGRSALLHRWLAGYGGYGSLAAGRICGQQRKGDRWTDRKVPAAVKSIMRCRRSLIRRRPCRR